MSGSYFDDLAKGMAQHGSGLAQAYNKQLQGAHFQDAKFCTSCGTGLVQQQKKTGYRFDAMTGEPVMVKLCPNGGCAENCQHKYKYVLRRHCLCCGDIK